MEEDSKVPVALSAYVWKSVRYALVYQISRLERKAERTGSGRTAEYDNNRIGNLNEAVLEITAAIDEDEALVRG